MTASLLLNDILLWCAQMALFIGIAALLPPLLALKIPKARLAFWQLVLLTSLILPAIRPWKRDLVDGAVTVSTAIVATAPTPATRSFFPFSIPVLLLLVAVAGILVRLGLLLAGALRLRRYRLDSKPLSPPSPWGVEADLRIAEGIVSPVTFGFRKPLVLLPPGFLSLAEGMQDAILCHEILHVRRHDWVLTVGGEFIRALFWFHPAIWWLLREIQLAREQAVDREVVEMTRSRDQYIDALLVIAGAPQSDLAPAPPFLRKRHLKQRVASILKEVRMSTTQTVSAFGASLTLLAASCWFITGALPLHAAPQIPPDAAGVSVDTSGADLLHRDPVTYPREAIAKGVQGTVVASLKLDSAGNVTDATIVSGPEELRKAVLQSVLNWHFTPAAGAGGTKEVTATFVLPADAGQTVQPTVRERALAANRIVESIQINGLTDQARQQLQAQLPVHEGDTLTADNFAQLVRTVHAFDSHLQAISIPNPAGGSAIVISLGRTLALPITVHSRPQAPPATESIHVGGNAQETKLITNVTPVYPPLAKAARVQGTVRFEATIGKDGTVQNLELLSGPPLLVQAATQAVQQWVYEPTLLNGNPVEVVTTIDINFTLAQ